MYGTHAMRLIPPSDLDCGEIENYGTDSEVGAPLNRDGTSDYGEFTEPGRNRGVQSFGNGDLNR